ncbi:MAG: MFS transporter [Oscillibacter sp.]|nr:MFS transporter [Oscillibacter sp.]
MNVSEERTYQKASFLIVFVVLSANVINTMGGLVNPTLATMAQAYPDVSLSTIQLVATLPMLAAIPTSFFAGKFINKLGVKRAFILSFSAFMISSVIPTCFRTSFTPVLVCRFITGLTTGVISPLTAALVNTYIEPPRRPSMFGYKQAVGNITGIILTSLVGIIAARNVFNIWYVHLLLVFPIGLGLLLPKAPHWGDPAPAAKSGSGAAAQKEKLPMSAWGIILLMFLFSVFSYPALLNFSSLIDANGMGDASLAGFVQTAANIGGILGTLFFGKIYKKVGKYVIPVFMVLLVLRHFLLGLTDNVILYFVAMFVGGIGYFGLFVAFTTGLSVNCSAGSFHEATGIMSAMMNVGMFISPYIMNFIASLFGLAGSLAFPVILGGAGFVIIAVILFVKPVRM